MAAIPNTAFLTVSEAARLLRVSEGTVRRLVRRGQLPGVRVGAQWRIDADGLGDAARATNPERSHA